MACTNTLSLSNAFRSLGIKKFSTTHCQRETGSRSVYYCVRHRFRVNGPSYHMYSTPSRDKSCVQWTPQAKGAEKQHVYPFIVERPSKSQGLLHHTCVFWVHQQCRALVMRSGSRGSSSLIHVFSGCTNNAERYICVLVPADLQVFKSSSLQVGGYALAIPKRGLITCCPSYQ